eukprot:scaffold7460_cov430-Prasinococcus_capsulatus_cf.AAC.1
MSLYELEQALLIALVLDVQQNYVHKRGLRSLVRAQLVPADHDDRRPPRYQHMTSQGSVAGAPPVANVWSLPAGLVIL